MHADTLLIAMAVILGLPWLAWRLCGRDRVAPLVVVQIVAGILLGPGVLGRHFPELHREVFTGPVMTAVNAIALWAVMIFVWVAGVELDLKAAWAERRESLVTAALALATPLVLGALVAAALLGLPGFIGAHAEGWQYVAGVGMAAAVTALPVLLIFMDKLELVRTALGQRILRYASLDDLAIWAVLALIVLDWTRLLQQAAFLAGFAAAVWGLHRLMPRLDTADRWHLSLLWLVLCALGAEWSGLHYMVGAFLAGAALDGAWFEREAIDRLRYHVLVAMMPFYFLSTGLRTSFEAGGLVVIAAGIALLAAAVAGKLAGVYAAGRLLGWRPGEAFVIGWLLQTKALIMIVFANVLLDKALISGNTFTALLVMAIGSTLLTLPIVTPRLAALRKAGAPGVQAPGK